MSTRLRKSSNVQKLITPQPEFATKELQEYLCNRGGGTSTTLSDMKQRTQITDTHTHTQETKTQTNRQTETHTPTSIRTGLMPDSFLNHDKRMTLTAKANRPAP